MHASPLLMRGWRLFPLWLFSLSLVAGSCFSPPKPVQQSSPASASVAAPFPPPHQSLVEEPLQPGGTAAASPSALPSDQPPAAAPVPPNDQTRTILAGPKYGQVDHIVKSVASGALPQVDIVGIKQSDSEDGQTVLIEGTLRNRGAVATKWVKVKIEAQDEAGRALTTVNPQPALQVIPPGGSTTFAARVANSPAFRKFSIKADFR